MIKVAKVETGDIRVQDQIAMSKGSSTQLNESKNEISAPSTESEENDHSGLRAMSEWSSSNDEASEADGSRLLSEGSPWRFRVEDYFSDEWRVQFRERTFGKGRSRRETDINQTHRQQGDRWRPHYESHQRLDGTSFHRTPPTEPRAMTELREARHAAGQPQSDERKSQGRKRKRDRSRSRHRRRSPNRTETGLSPSRRSPDFHRIASQTTSHPGFGRRKPRKLSAADYVYQGQRKPVQEGTKKQHPRNSGKR